MQFMACLTRVALLCPFSVNVCLMAFSAKLVVISFCLKQIIISIQQWDRQNPPRPFLGLLLDAGLCFSAYRNNHAFKFYCCGTSCLLNLALCVRVCALCQWGRNMLASCCLGNGGWAGWAGYGVADRQRKLGCLESLISDARAVCRWFGVKASYLYCFVLLFSFSFFFWLYLTRLCTLRWLWGQSDCVPWNWI